MRVRADCMMLDVASSFTWLDTSEHDRRQALDVISLFRQRGTLDELGIGTVRDALADLLFPGTSTIQTRARYFLFVPWIYQSLERGRVSSADAPKKARKAELRLAEVLTATEAGSPGVIGSEAGDTLKRLPSSVYWGGLGTWGIRLFQGSLDQYHRSLDRFRARASQIEDWGDLDAPRATWHAHLPEIPDAFPSGQAFTLARHEAAYLRDRIRERLPGSMLAELVALDRADAETQFPWQVSSLHAMPQRVREIVDHARAFSEMLHGAALLYNLMLAQASERSEAIELYSQRLAGWAESTGAHRDRLEVWERERFWSIVRSQNERVPIPTRAFVDSWLDLVLSDGAEAMAESDAARELIARREKTLKGSRARLQSRAHLEQWGGSTASEPLRYRWNVVQSHVHDIMNGLRQGEDFAPAG